MASAPALFILITGDSDQEHVATLGLVLGTKSVSNVQVEGSCYTYAKLKNKLVSTEVLAHL